MWDYGRGRITSAPAGIDCTLRDFVGQSATGTCLADFPAGSTVTLTATPLDGGTFDRWGGFGCEATPDPVCVVTMTQNYGGFVGIKPQTFPLTVLSGGGNGTGVVRPFAGVTTYKLACPITRGVANAQFCTGPFPYGAQVTLDIVSSITGTSQTKSVVSSACPTSTPGCRAFTVTGPTTVTVTFEAREITVLGPGTGSGRVVGPLQIDCSITPTALTGTCSRVYDTSSGAGNITFTATPDPGSVFAGWGGQCTGTGTCVTSGDFPPNVNLIARFELATYPLTVTAAGNGAGSVQSSPVGIACNANVGSTSGTCVAQLAGGVTLTATPNAGSGFTGWSGACSGTGPCTVSMSEARSVSARFDITVASLSVTGSGSGSVASAPAGIDCTLTDGTASGACSAAYNVGSPVTLTATPASGWTFTGWGGACSGTSTCQPDLSRDRAVTAAFKRAPVALALKGAGTGDGSVTAAGVITCTITRGAASTTGCDAVVDQNTSLTLTADPQGGSTFVGWEGDGCSGAALTCALTLSQARTITARFTAPRAARDIALALLGTVTLSADERTQLDRFGNKDGSFNLGDLLALLDRTGERLTPATIQALTARGRLQ